jgi:hypothetical protein
MASHEAELVIIQKILQGVPRIKNGQNIYHSCSAAHVKSRVVSDRILKENF